MLCMMCVYFSDVSCIVCAYACMYVYMPMCATMTCMSHDMQVKVIEQPWVSECRSSSCTMLEVGSHARPASPWASWGPLVPTSHLMAGAPRWQRHTAVSGFERAQGIQNDLLGLGAHQPLSYGFSPRTFNFFLTLPTLSSHQPWSISAFPGNQPIPSFYWTPGAPIHHH